jgi:hypothetical protein
MGIGGKNGILNEKILIRIVPNVKLVFFPILLCIQDNNTEFKMSKNVGSQLWQSLVPSLSYWQNVTKRVIQAALKAGLPGPKKLKRPNLAITSFKKGQISLKKFVKKSKLKIRISLNARNLLRFVQNMP